MPAPTTAQVATVLHRTSVPAKFQIARSEATTATTMQALVIQNANLVTTRGLRKPRFINRLSGICRNDDQVRSHWAEIGYRRDSQREMARIVAHPNSHLQTIRLRVVGC